MKQPEIVKLTQNALTALNSLMVADEMSSEPRAILKIARFKEWLKNIATGLSTHEPVNDSDCDELNDTDSEERTNESTNNNTETIKFD